MGRRLSRCFATVLIMFIASAGATAAAPVKISVFNFRTVNLEASGYGTTVTNMLINYLKAEPSLVMLDRKELETFLSLNDLQQDDNMEHVVDIGTRLGLDVIVVGSVEKRGSVVAIQCTAIRVEQRKPLLVTQARAFGDAGLESEIKKMGSQITSAVAVQAEEEAKTLLAKGPVNLQKRSGIKRIQLTWENAPEVATAGYEVFRSKAEGGPYDRIARVDRPGYVDQDVEKGVKYYYKIRSFDIKGAYSTHSAVISAETVFSPNPPIILRAESRIRSINLNWAPNPMSSGDPLKLKGYKLYRAKMEGGPYSEVANIPCKEIGMGGDTAATPDKLARMSYLDKGLTDGMQYYYTVTAYNEKNLESEYSCPLGATTVLPVNGLSAESGRIREIRLTWRAVAATSVKGYYILRSVVEGGDFTRIGKVDASATQGDKVSYVDEEGLTDQTCYYYRVTAFENADAETPLSSVVSAVTKGKPPAPTGLRATSGLVKRVALSWNVISDEDGQGYNLYWSGDKKGPYEFLKKIEGRMTATFIDGGRGAEKLADGTPYFYLIRSFNRVGVESELSEVVTAVTKPRPVRPAGIVVQAFRVREVPVSWSPNPEADVDTYHVYRSTQAANEEFERIGTVKGEAVYTDKGLKDGYAYRYKIQAQNRDGLLSDFSEPVGAQTKPKPNSPEGLTGKYSEGTVDLRWEPPAGAQIAYYTVYEKRFFGLVRVETVKASLYHGDGPAKGKSRTYVVTATDPDGLESDASQEFTGVGK